MSACNVITRFGILAGLCLVTPVVAQENSVGPEAFRVACAVCHGMDGRGGGEFADVLTVRPPDLTKLSQKNDGVFPYLRVFQTIDGRASIRAHGTPVMPIWGDTFTKEIGRAAGPFGTELLVRARIVALVDYIETIQQ